MPHLHFHIYSFIDRIWALLATGATEYSNMNVVSGNCLIGDLNLAHNLKEVQVLRALAEQVALHQSQGTPILAQASISSKYCPMEAITKQWPKPAPPCTSPPKNTGRQDGKMDNFPGHYSLADSLC